MSHFKMKAVTSAYFFFLQGKTKLQVTTPDLSSGGVNKFLSWRK